MPLQVNVQDWHWIISAWLLIADKKLFRYIEMLLLLCLLHFQIQGTVRSKKSRCTFILQFCTISNPITRFVWTSQFFSFDKYVLHLVFQTIQLRYLDIFKSRLRCLHSTQAKLIHSRNRLGRCFCKSFEWRTDWATVVVAVCFVCDVWHNPSLRTYDLYWNTDLIDVLIRLRLFDKLQRRRRHLS